MSNVRRLALFMSLALVGVLTILVDATACGRHRHVVQCQAAPCQPVPCEYAPAPEALRVVLLTNLGNPPVVKGTMFDTNGTTRLSPAFIQVTDSNMGTPTVYGTGSVSTVTGTVGDFNSTGTVMNEPWTWNTNLSPPSKGVFWIMFQRGSVGMPAGQPMWCGPFAWGNGNENLCPALP